MQYVVPPCATLDVESFSLAGHRWSDGKWRRPDGAPQNKIGLPVVGAAPYWEHPSAEILCLSYRLPHWPVGTVDRWRPGQPMPEPLRQWLADGGHIEFHHAMFEKLGWHHVLVARHGWPPLDHSRVHCSMATAHVNGYPGALEKLGEALVTDFRKDAEGKRLMDVFSKPRNPTKGDDRTRILPDDPTPVRYAGALTAPTMLFERYHAYCDTDVLSEESAADLMQPMTWPERCAWLQDQAINWRGLAVDRPAVRDCIAVLEQALDRYGRECEELTGGVGVSQGEKLLGWIAGRGVSGIWSFDQKKQPIEELLERTDLPDDVRRVLEIRALVGSAGVKKLYAIEHRASADDRLRGLFVHHGTRTGRPTGEGVQTTNLVKVGPKLQECASCERPYGTHRADCPWCGGTASAVKPGWRFQYVDSVLEIMAFRSLDMIESFFGDAQRCLQGCIRGLFVAAPGHDLIASDYSAIEAVVAACISGEQWRIEVFRNRQDIYLMSAAKITGNTLEFYQQYFEQHGENHPDRQHVGKVAELACLGGNTLVWTCRPNRRGSKWKRIVDVQPDDLVFDGHQWVTHGGLVKRGNRPAIVRHGVAATKDHQVRVTSRRWAAFGEMDDLDWSKAADLAGRQYLCGLFSPNASLLPVTVGDQKTYDLAACGARNQFVIASELGPIVVHNCGFGGWIGSWRAFDPNEADKSDQQLTEIILAWREASPRIVEMWGGQRRKDPVSDYWRDELFGIEGAMISAIRAPGTHHRVGPLSFCYYTSYERSRWVYNPESGWRVETRTVPCDWLKMALPSGRELTYHQPRLRQSEKRPGSLAISYMTDNTNPKYGALGWVRMDTWGSRCFENAVQAIAHDIQRHSMAAHEAAGYPIVQEVYDENVAEVPHGFGSIEEFEAIMSTNPPWAFLPDGSPWPIRASGGWRGRRYRKG